MGPSVAAVGCGVVATGCVGPMRPHLWCLLLLLLTGGTGSSPLPVLLMELWSCCGSEPQPGEARGALWDVEGEKCAWEGR